MGEPTLLTQLAEQILATLRPRPQDCWDDRLERVKAVLTKDVDVHMEPGKLVLTITKR